MKYRCAREDNKPEVCQRFPQTAGEIKEFPSCTYYFEDGRRNGYCSWCGECCKRPYLYLPEFGKKFTEEPCPYLKEERES